MLCDCDHMIASCERALVAFGAFFDSLELVTPLAFEPAGPFMQRLESVPGSCDRAPVFHPPRVDQPDVAQHSQMLRDRRLRRGRAPRRSRSPAVRRRRELEDVAAPWFSNRVEGVELVAARGMKAIIFLYRNMSSVHFRSAYDPGYLSTMKYLCLIHLNEGELASMPARDASDLNARHLDFNDGLRETGHFIVAEALAPAQDTTRVTTRGGTLHITDGPFTEAKEVIAGFYLIEANDMKEATEIASRIPSASFGTVEVRPCRQLIVEGRALRWG